MKKTLLTCLTLVGVLGTAYGISTQQKARTATAVDYTVKTSSFYLRGIDRGSGIFDIAISLNGYDVPSEDTSKVGSVNDKTLPKYQALKFFGYLTINGKPMADWGKTSEEGFTMNAYVPINGADCKQNIIFRFNYSGTLPKINSVGVKKEFQLPSYAYLNDLENPVVYQADCDYVGESTGGDYGWTTTGYTDINRLYVAQGYSESEKTEYLAFDINGDDYEGEQLEKNDDPNAYNYMTNVTGESSEFKPLKAYGLFGLGTAGQGKFCPQAYAEQESDLNTIVVPKGTIFPARATTMFKKNGQYNPRVVYKTQTDKTFKMVEGEYVCDADLTVYKTEQVAALRKTVKFEDYDQAEQDEINKLLADLEKELMETNAYDNYTKVDAKVKETAEEIKKIPTTKDKQELQKKKDEAKLAISLYKKEVLYYEEEIALREKMVIATQDAIDKASSSFVVNECLEAGKKEIDSLPSAYDKGIAAVENYKKDVEYREAEATAKAKIISEAKEDILKLKTTAEIDTCVAEAKAAIDKLKTAEEYEKEELEAAKITVKATIKTYKTDSMSLYRAAQQAEIIAIKEAAYVLIDGCTSKDDLADIQTATLAAIDEVKTDEELTKEELVAAQTSGKAEIKEYIQAQTPLVEKYSVENQQKIGELYRKANADIDACTKIDQITPIVTQFKKDFDAIPKVNPVTPSKSSNLPLILSLSIGIPVLVGGTVLVIYLIHKNKKKIKE